jgi:hypothetical protein
MGRVVELFRDVSFDPETIKAMDAAYDIARRSLHDRGQPAVVEEIIAKRIIALARNGERNPAVLATHALRALGLKAVIE